MCAGHAVEVLRPNERDWLYNTLKPCAAALQGDHPRVSQIFGDLPALPQLCFEGGSHRKAPGSCMHG